MSQNTCNKTLKNAPNCIQPCPRAFKRVCNLFCSIQDPSSTNEMHRIHMPGDIRCISQYFECPTCNESFSSSSSLQNHISKEHVQETSRSMISEANSSSWMHVPCPQCGKRFENDGDMKYHLVRVHEYGEECALYPCEECGYSGQDIPLRFTDWNIMKMQVLRIQVVPVISLNTQISVEHFTRTQMKVLFNILLQY